MGEAQRIGFAERSLVHYWLWSRRLALGLSLLVGLGCEDAARSKITLITAMPRDPLPLAA